MKRIIISVLALIIFAGSAIAAEIPVNQGSPIPAGSEMAIEWNYPAAFNAAISGFRIYHARKSIPWGRHRGELPPGDAQMQMVQVDNPNLRTYKLMLPAGANYIRMNAIYMRNNQIVESFFSEQTKVNVKGADVGTTPPSDLKLQDTAPTHLKVK